MFTLQELIKIGEWLNKKFVGTFYISFAKGFEGEYIIVETERDCREGRQVFSIREILSEE